MAKDFTNVIKGIKENTPTPKEPKKVEDRGVKIIEELTEIIEREEATKNQTAKTKLETIKNDPNKSSFTFKASSEVLHDLRALATIKKTTQAEIIEDALIEYYKAHLEEYSLALKLRKDFNL